LPKVPETKIDIKSGFPLTASIAYEKVPEVLKTIMVTLTSGEKVFSFLLRANKEKTKYEAVITSPDPGVYPLTMNILDYKNQRLKVIKGELIIKGESAMAAKITWYQQWGRYIYIVVAILILIIFYLIRRTIREKRKIKQDSK